MILENQQHISSVPPFPNTVHPSIPSFPVCAIPQYSPLAIPSSPQTNAARIIFARTCTALLLTYQQLANTNSVTNKMARGMGFGHGLRGGCHLPAPSVQSSPTSRDNPRICASVTWWATDCISELVSLLVSLGLKVTYIMELLWPSLIEMVHVTLIELSQPRK